MAVKADVAGWRAGGLAVAPEHLLHSGTNRKPMTTHAAHGDQVLVIDDAHMRDVVQMILEDAGSTPC